MVRGEINAIEPPYTLRVRGTASLPAFLMTHLSEPKEDCTEARIAFNARLDRDVEVDVEILP